MTERRKIVEMWQRDEIVALATLIRVEGSSYRRAGARLAIGRDGSYVGSVSGGCLEAEIVRKAQWMVRDGATVQRYSTLFDDTAEIPYGLGCGGTVDVLIEPADTPEFNALMEAFFASLNGETRAVATWVPAEGKPLARAVLSGTGNGDRRSSRVESTDGEQPIQEILSPPQRVFIFGAGDDAQPMVRMAALLGWTVHVLDSRVQWAKAERFPEARSVQATSHLHHLSPNADDAVILMTHSYEKDRSWLELLLPREPRYVGLLGSRHRSALLLAEAAQALGWPLERACERVFSPVGLDLGGDGAEAVALSAVAELQACLHGKLGHSRRMTPATIAEQIAQGGASRYLQAQCAL
ncbi:MAG TPA: XdhC family protein [Acidobacteriaceae bacterium]|nr:XdhC family protein [Acidobacteriaceae bacterium]